jgi:hypothetical protein
MGYQKIGPVRQIWYVVKYKINAWVEWQDALYWAKEYHPAWVELVKKGKHEETRKAYRKKILAAYRGEDYG